MATVETRALVKEFGEGVRAVDSIDLACREGEFLVLLGPSGCGKTTLLRMIGGLEEPSSGDILIGGQVVNDLPPRARQIAMVFQSYALYPHLSVYNNIAFPLKAAKTGKQVEQERVAWAAGILGIDQLLKRKPRQLSGGQRQRVALARALVRHPDVLLLDEPLSNLDAQMRATARDELLQFQNRIGTTSIYVTHDQVEAMGMGDRIAVISQGRLRQLGTPFEIYDDPADTFVATFVGSPPMNLVPRGEELHGFRPENVAPVAMHVRAGISRDDLVTYDVTITRHEYLGSERLVYGESGGNKVVARFPASTAIDADPGTTVEYAVRRADLRRFDTASGERVASRPLVMSSRGVA